MGGCLAGDLDTTNRSIPARWNVCVLAMQCTRRRLEDDECGRRKATQGKCNGMDGRACGSLGGEAGRGMQLLEAGACGWPVVPATRCSALCPATATGWQQLQCSGRNCDDGSERGQFLLLPVPRDAKQKRNVGMAIRRTNSRGPGVGEASLLLEAKAYERKTEWVKELPEKRAEDRTSNSSPSWSKRSPTSPIPPLERGAMRLTEPIPAHLASVRTLASPSIATPIFLCEARSSLSQIHQRSFRNQRAAACPVRHQIASRQALRSFERHASARFTLNSLA